MLRAVRRFLESHGEGRFTWWHRASDDDNAKPLQRAGFRRMVDQGGKPIKSDAEHQREYGERMAPADGEGVSVDYFVLPEVFRAEVCQGFDYQARTGPGHRPCIRLHAAFARHGPVQLLPHPVCAVRH